MIKTAMRGISRTGKAVRSRCRAAVPALSVAWLLAGVAAGAPPGARAASSSPPKPNIIQIVLDDATAEMIGPDTTPAIWREIVTRSTSFGQAIVTSPACCPSRASMLTGQYGHNNGVLANFPGYPALQEKDNILPGWLHRAGYWTAHVGKVIFRMPFGEPGFVEPGWDVWNATPSMRYDMSRWSFHGQKRIFSARPRNEMTRMVNRIATREAEVATPPFYLHVAHLAPHLATVPDDGSRCVGHPRYQGPLNVPFPSVKPPRGPSYNQADTSDRPPLIQSWRPITRTRQREILRSYRCAVAALAAVDRGVDRIFKVLRERRLAARTAVILTSDNGMSWGQHRVGPAKHVPYDEATRVPLFIRLPAELRTGKERRKTGARVALLDLAPTILELAGATPCVSDDRCRRLDGRSLVSAAQGRFEPWHTTRAIGLELDTAEWMCAYRGLRAPQGTYVRYLEMTEHAARPGASNPCVPSSFTELYGPRDPFALHNLAFGPRAGGTLERELGQRSERIATCTGIAGREPPPPDGRSYCE